MFPTSYRDDETGLDVVLGRSCRFDESALLFVWVVAVCASSISSSPGRFLESETDIARFLQYSILPLVFR
jgi:hypothetical protein